MTNFIALPKCSRFKGAMRRFIASRINRDNFWNLMFFALWNIGLGLAFFIASIGGKESVVGSIAMLACWVMIPGIPYFIKRNAGITFDKEKMQFLNREGQELNGRAPNVLLMISLTAICAALVTTCSDGSGQYTTNHIIVLSTFCVMITLVPTLYCMIKNFPIIIYFKKETWIGSGTTSNLTSNHTRSHHTSCMNGASIYHRSIHSSTMHSRSSESMMSGFNMRTSNVNSWYSGNIHNRK
jgi:hypothetical protein